MFQFLKSLFFKLFCLSQNNNMKKLRNDYASSMNRSEKQSLLLKHNMVYEDVAQVVEAKNLINKTQEYLDDSFKKIGDFYNSWQNSTNLPLLLNGDCNIVYFFGNNGVGKTTTIVNFAIELKKINQEVVIIAADEFRGGAVEQLCQMCAKNNIASYSAKDYEKEPSLPQIIFDGITHHLEKKTKVILVDTAGRSHNDVNLVDNLKKQYDLAEKSIKSSAKDINSKIQVSSIWVNDGNIVNAFQSQKAFMGKIPLDYIIITKIKESSSYYNLINMMNHLEKPIIYYSTSRDNLIPFTPTAFMENLS